VEFTSWNSTAVSYDPNTHQCRSTLYFDPPIYTDWVYAFFWANDTYGHESRSGIVGLMHNAYPYSGPGNEAFDILGVALILAMGLAGIVIVHKIRQIRGYRS
jgi:hypothetical protein